MGQRRVADGLARSVADERCVVLLVEDLLLAADARVHAGHPDASGRGGVSGGAEAWPQRQLAAVLRVGAEGDEGDL